MSTIQDKLNTLAELKRRMIDAIQLDKNQSSAMKAQQEFNDAVKEEFQKIHEETKGLECECACGGEETDGLDNTSTYSVDDFLINLDFSTTTTEGLQEMDQVTKNQLEFERQEELLRKYTQALSIVE